MENKNVPRVRFEGFNDAWEQRKWSNIVSRITVSSDAGDLPKVKFEDIVSGQGRLKNNISTKIDSRKGTVFLKDDILYGKLRPYLNNWLYAEFEGIALGDFWVFRANLTNSIFDYFLMQSNVFQNVANNTSGTKMPRSDWKSVSNELFLIPKLEEQKLIGNVLNKMDSAIASNQRKLDSLKKVKKTMMQKIFDQTWRFEGFTDPWEQRKLGELGKTYSGLSGKSKNDFGHGEAKFVTYVNVFNNAMTSNTQINAIEIDSHQNEVKYGDVFFTTSSETPDEVGMSSVWLFNYKNVYLNSFCFGWRLNNLEIIDLKFISNLLRSNQLRKKLNLLAQGISRFNISKTKLMDEIVLLPTKNEQINIGILLSNIEGTIASNQLKIDKLKETKKWLMQNMFL